MRAVVVDYSEELGKRICKLIAEGFNLKRLCRIKGMPHRASVHRWRIDGEHEEFARQYDLARIVAIEAHFDDLIETAKSAMGGDSAHVQAVRLQVDTMKWALVKVIPKVYGDRVDVNHGANDMLRSLMETIQEDANCGPGASKSRQQPESDSVH